MVEDLTAGIGWHITGYEIARAALDRWTKLDQIKLITDIFILI